MGCQYTKCRKPMQDLKYELMQLMSIFKASENWQISE